MSADKAFPPRGRAFQSGMRLATGEHCPKGLICLGCAHAQPKKSAVPIFRRMLASHERSLVAARNQSEPAGQIAAREMEIVRIKGALRRAAELSDDVLTAAEAGLVPFLAPTVKTSDARNLLMELVAGPDTYRI